MIARIRSADVAFTNFEMLVHDFQYSPASVSGGTYLGAPPYVLEELRWAGFRMISTANNHAMDYGAAALMNTINQAKQAGLACAGTGENLARARAPAYFDTRLGRVALIACSSTFSDLCPAGEQRPDLAGRPGLNPLHFQTIYTVDPLFLADLRSLSKEGGYFSAGPAVSPNVLQFLGVTFQSGPKLQATTEPDPKDLRAITAEIHDARKMADWVMASVHSHEKAQGKRELPAQFFRIFAHAAIEAGADMVVGHGPHLLRGIEIYHGRPIFYSMGNFIFQHEMTPFQPQENYDQYDLPLSALPGDFYDARAKENNGYLNADREYWESVEAEVLFNSDHTLREIDLYPLSLGLGKTFSERGRPLPAEGTDAARIISRLSALSLPMGTIIQFDGAKGVIKID
jgi:poly-gamma-glutamate synthesis protein (capsule biosynthesis protein)